MKTYFNGDLQITNNQYINSPLQIASKCYFDWSVSYPEGKIRFDVDFWQEIDGQRLDYSWNRAFEKSIDYDVSSQEAALDILKTMVPELFQDITINNPRRFVGITQKASAQDMQNLINEVGPEGGRFEGYWKLAGKFDDTDTTSHYGFNWFMNDDEQQYLRNKYGVTSKWDLIFYLENNLGTTLYEIPPFNVESILNATRLKITGKV